MSNFNRVIQGGRLVADPEKTTTKSGHTLVKFTIAVNRVGKDKDVADFFDVEAWRETGDYVAAYQQKGNRVLVEGRLKQQRWENSDGQKRSRIVIVADRVVGYDYNEEATPVGVGAGKDDTEDIPF